MELKPGRGSTVRIGDITFLERIPVGAWELHLFPICPYFSSPYFLSSRKCVKLRNVREHYLEKLSVNESYTQGLAFPQKRFIF